MTHVHDKVFWLQSDVLGAGLRDRLSQVFLPLMDHFLRGDTKVKVWRDVDVFSSLQTQVT